MLQIDRVVFACAIAAGTFGCGSFLGGANEVVLAPTEVGSPLGDAVTKDIGPAGGTLSSADGRLTLTVTQNALRENVRFSIQPISNMAANGVGTGYRLGPDGSKFSTPLRLTFRYDEADLEGTAAEAFAFAYQDEKGSWRALRSGSLDSAAKTLTVSTTHFTDYSVLSRMKLTPNRATLRPAERQVITTQVCEEPGLIDRILSRPVSCQTVADPFGVFTLNGPGQIEEAGDGNVIYTAPGRKPNPNEAWVTYTADLFTWTDGNQSQTSIRIELNARILIVDNGYKAIGSWGGMRWSGPVCDLQKPFNILGEAPYLTFVFNFTPSADGRSGTAGVGGGGYGVTLYDGKGKYTVSGADTDKPTIALTMESFKGSYPGVGTAQGSGTRYINLVPLETNECDGQ